MSLFKNKRGQALVEMALILPLLILLLCGIIEFGRIFNTSLIISNASREGARKASLGANDTEIKASISNSAASKLNQSLMTVSISPSPAVRIYGAEAEVRIDYKLNLITPVISSILPNPLPLSSKTVMRVE